MKGVISIAAVLLMVGCFRSYSNEDMHKIFLARNQMLIGRQDVRKRYDSIPPGTILKNGLIEIRESSPRLNCSTYYQYDPNTFIIQNWRWEGTECLGSP
jgi:hypothetical protein